MAVVSLPAGVFKPYSGVKTSILILDKALARKTNHIAFFKVENDGFDLGDQRKLIGKNDLPQVQAELEEYLSRLRVDQSVDDYQLAFGTVVEKEKIAADGEHNLSGERYREVVRDRTKYEWTELGKVTLGKPQYGSGARKVPYDGHVRYVRITDITDHGALKSDDIVSPSAIEPDLFLELGDLLIARSGSVGRTYIHKDIPGTHQYAGYLIRFHIDPEKALPEYVFQVTKSHLWHDWIVSNSKTGTLTNINAKQYSSFRFPLPPLNVQQDIVAEIEGYQRVIAGARTVMENYRPHIAIDPEWPMVELGRKDVFNVKSGGTPRSEVKEYWDGGLPWITLVDLPPEHFITEITSTERTISVEGLQNSAASMIPANSIVVSSRATIGRIGINRISLATNQGFKNVVIKDSAQAIPEYVALALTKLVPTMQAQASGATYKEITKTKFSELQIPLPPLDIQQSIVAEIQAEQVLVESNRELIQRFEEKIQAAMTRVWESESSIATDT